LIKKQVCHDSSSEFSSVMSESAKIAMFEVLEGLAESLPQIVQLCLALVNKEYLAEH
jgi:hypothetical protein